VSARVALRVKHADLLSFMFFQLGQAILGGRGFRQCIVCGKSSLLLPGVNRKDRITCSDYCRLKLWRERKAADELHRAGWSAAKIAKRIGWDIGRVKEWLRRR
jgi:hypothetical protein